MGADPTRFGLPPEAVEVVEARTETAKHFVLPDGTGAAVIGLGPLHFRQTAGGPWLDPSEMVIQRSAPGTWTVTTTDIHIAANYGAMQITHLPTNQSWTWNFLGQGSGDSIIYQGIPWQYEPSPWGVKSHATVTERRGPQTYQWTYNTNIPSPTVDAEGNIVAGRFVIPRAFVIGADGERYECGGWELAWPYVRFGFDDSGLPDEAFPYVIDPSTEIGPHAQSGHIFKYNAQYNTARSGVGAGSSLGHPLLVGQMHVDSDYFVFESFLAFDASGLPPEEPTGVSLRLTPRLIFGATNYVLEARAHNWLPTLGHDSWVPGANLASLPLLATLDAAAAVRDQAVTFTESGTALRDAVAARGTVQMVIASSRSRTGTPPATNTQEYITFYLTDAGVTPVLVVDYGPTTGTLSGTVTDAATSQGIVGATVTLTPGNYQVTTTAGGAYELLDVPAGNYTATYSHVDYQQVQRPVTITENHTTVEDVALTPRDDLRFVSAGAVAHGPHLVGGSIDIPLPSERRTGDLLLLFVSNQADPSTLDTPAGWTLAASIPSDTSRTWVFSRIADGSEPGSITVNPTGGAVARIGFIAAYRDGDPSAPVEVWDATRFDSGATLTAPAVTTGRDGNLALRFWRVTGQRTFTVPASHTRRFASNLGPSIALDERAMPTAGSTGTASTTASGSGRAMALTLSLNAKQAADPLPLASGRVIVRGHGLTLEGGPADLPLASGTVVVRGHGVEIQGGPIDLPLASGRVLVRGHGVEIVPVAPPLTLPALHRPLVTVGTAWHVPVITLTALHRPVVTIGGDMRDGAMGASDVPLELAITPGEARTIRWEVKGIDGQPEMSMGGWTMKFFILHNRRDANGLTELANRAILVKDATANAPFAVVEFDSADTLSLPPKALEFELWRVDDGDERRLAYGQFPVVS